MLVLANPASVIPAAGPITAVPPDLAAGSPERDDQLEDVAGERALRCGGVDLRGARPAARVRPVRRRPGEDADEEVVLLAIDNRSKELSEFQICGQSGPPRRGVRHGGRFFCIPVTPDAAETCQFN